MTRARATIGELGERAAERHLRKAGFKTLGRNARLAGGEIDLVMLAPDRRTVVVVEVKARVRRDGDGQPRPEANITATKRAQLVKLARALRHAEGWTDRPMRIDVVAVEFAPVDADRQRSPVARAARWIGVSIPRPRVAALRHIPSAVSVTDSRRGTR